MRGRQNWRPELWKCFPSLPYLVALVLIADGQQIQQHFVEVAQGEVDTHHCHGVTGGHLRAGEERRRAKMKGASIKRNKKAACKSELEL